MEGLKVNFVRPNELTLVMNVELTFIMDGTQDPTAITEERLRAALDADRVEIKNSKLFVSYDNDPITKGRA